MISIEDHKRTVELLKEKELLNIIIKGFSCEIFPYSLGLIQTYEGNGIGVRAPEIVDSYSYDFHRLMLSDLPRLNDIAKRAMLDKIAIIDLELSRYILPQIEESVSK